MFVSAVFQWRWFFVVPVFLVFLVTDSVFFLAGVSKFFEGAWLPVLLSAFLGALMATWLRGRQLSAMQTPTRSLTAVMASFANQAPLLPGTTGVFLSRSIFGAEVPWALEMLCEQYGGLLHERNVLLRLKIGHSESELALTSVSTDLGGGFCLAEATWDGVVGEFDLFKSLAEALPNLDRNRTTFYLHREMPIPRAMSAWRTSVYSVLLQLGFGTLPLLLSGERTVQIMKRVYI